LKSSLLPIRLDAADQLVGAVRTPKLQEKDNIFLDLRGGLCIKPECGRFDAQSLNGLHQLPPIRIFMPARMVKGSPG
jgi:hypothetical protein